MNKSILVIDTPMNCEECPCYTDEMISKNWNICRRLNKKVDTEENKPYWCPLKPMPEKKDYYGTYAQGYSEYEAQYWDGYNDCIDDILGEEGRNRHEGETR